jgi:cbb3-type cytochrome oxidase subunit 3
MKQLATVGLLFLFLILIGCTAFFIVGPEQAVVKVQGLVDEVYQILSIDLLLPHLDIIFGVLFVGVLFLVVLAVILSHKNKKRRYHNAYDYDSNLPDLYGYDSMIYDDEAFEDEFEFFALGSYGTVGNQYGRYATSMIPCPYCGHPVRGDQSFCTYCRQKIA